MQKRVEDFLHTTGMHFDSIDMGSCCDEFVAEMQRGLAGEPSSLLMLPTYLRVGCEVPLGKPIIVMDAGGTNFRVATVTFTAQGAKIENFTKAPMPGTRGRIGREQFYDAIVERLAPVIDTSENVGFCFSFPTEIQPNRDGRLVYFNKEVYVDGVDNDLIGEGINEALRRQGLPEKTFILLNDAVATLLGGVASTMDKAYDSHIGYILGTGTNTCYIEDCSRIGKSRAAQDMGGKMVVNMESGGYNRFARGDVDRELDAATNAPGHQRMEKMMSGYYQGTVIFRTVSKAVDSGLFSAAFSTGLADIDDFTMYEIDQFCFYPYGQNPLAGLCGSEEDTRTLYDIIDASFERAARLTAVNLAAILLWTGTGKSPARPVCVTAEGTTFYKSKLFRPKLDHYIRTFLNDTLGIYCEFHRAEDVTLIGTAVAGLLN